MSKDKYTIEDFIIFYFKYKLQNVPNIIVRNSHLQLYLGDFIQEHYPDFYKGVSPETIARTWRRIRESNRLEIEGMVAEKILKSKNEDIYKIFYVPKKEMVSYTLFEQ